MPAGRERGFTLLELAVVMLLLVIVLGIVGLKLSNNDRDDVRQESERLALLLESAREEAILTGAPRALVLSAGGYHFLAPNKKNDLAPITGGGIFRERAFPIGVTLAHLDVGGGDTVLVYPSGEITPFRLTLNKGDSAWRVRGEANGEIKALPPA